jgi:hypothetical protein
MEYKDIIYRAHEIAENPEQKTAISELADLIERLAKAQERFENRVTEAVNYPDKRIL